MREILFRGKDIAGNWHYGVPLVFTEDYVCITAPHTYNKAVEANTVGQYTGLTDKNGTKIFGGDVCQIKGVPRYDETPFVIEWNNEFGGWYWKDVDGSDTTDALWQIVTEKAEVIGNIHDNPELLKGETDNA